MVNFQPTVDTTRYAAVVIAHQSEIALCAPIRTSVLGMTTAPGGAMLTRPVFRMTLPFVTTSGIAEVMPIDFGRRAVKLNTAVITAHDSIKDSARAFRASLLLHTLRSAKEKFELKRPSLRSLDFAVAPSAANCNYRAPRSVSTLNTAILLFGVFGLIRKPDATMGAHFCFHAPIIP